MTLDPRKIVAAFKKTAEDPDLDDDDFDDEEEEAGDLIEKWQDMNKAYHFEGDSGLQKLEDLFKAIGYKGHGFRFGDPIHAFLSDNSGAVEKIIEWLMETIGQIPEWEESLRENIMEGPAPDRY